ncbi:hypothetical protein AUJ77_01060 [Candidatus Nomurabacteria bacterium CG1_02_43_90]|uniref:Uncharacterized protein n=1 Tax=Candidatus Nomurabacteria bacterium CG1_02_43_90 TaxID=1805281 RepID=A0A1J4V186_9BACT|nr:MAG: hypothetical protein AUJ77_01060 [Candidatus Nomurabacteria bacterium CG1_02_43_90]
MCTTDDAKNSTEDGRGGRLNPSPQEHSEHVPEQKAQGDGGRNPQTQRFLETGIGGQDCSRPAIF